MIKTFSIKEIIQASTDILNSQNLEKTNTRNTSDDNKKIIPNSDYKNIIDEKIFDCQSHIKMSKLHIIRMVLKVYIYTSYIIFLLI